jgi:hypothetical protein
MMSTSYVRNGRAVYDEDPDWQASLDYANDQERWPQTPRTPCANPDCDQLCVSLFCSESCREATEGPDHDDALASEEDIAAAGTFQADHTNLDGIYTLQSHPLPEAPASANVFVTLKGRPRRRGLIDGPALDAQIAATSVCEACGHAGLDFTSYADGAQQYAAAVARCPQYDGAFDF